MLSEHERKSLRAVEDLLIADDPEFAASFRSAQRRLPGRPDTSTYTIAICASVMLTLVLLTLSFPLPALMTSGAAMYFSWRRAHVLFSRKDQ
ncbi:DUF3040 domain-containing protein [Pseudonocardia asaccharolytica]|uniref:DUF3040 domain-containing protein n=1 Tax=Pseudonocardia asaccharolytica DSM 44247 = NBRC 16224 TaxID=1123024 RepID=A0A511D5U7_9PSEU|nr:DUF3040 domain-containing protein [Pseudonocardia asaccharolytica]GEL18298.1 hypothetical protein PA7_21350 [Pseudonocardia asaccharolytica DSM 44247 = NBRC 16224]